VKLRGSGRCGVSAASSGIEDFENQPTDTAAYDPEDEDELDDYGSEEGAGGEQDKAEGGKRKRTRSKNVLYDPDSDQFKRK